MICFCGSKDNSHSHIICDDGFVIPGKPLPAQLGWYERQELTVSTRLFDADAWSSAYGLGYRKPNYPMPALLQDSQSDLSIRWAQWYDSDRICGHKY